MTAPAPKHAAFLFYWTLFGSAASGFLFLGLTRAVPGRPVSNPGPAGRAAGDRWWLAAGIAAAFLVPAAIRLFLLRGASLTDDESAYRFMAQVLATGRLWADSHPLKAFFDRVFMINDGKFYGAVLHRLAGADGARRLGGRGRLHERRLLGAHGSRRSSRIARRMGGSAAARVALAALPRVADAHGRRRDRDVAPVVLDGARVDVLLPAPVARAPRAPGGLTLASRSSSASRS